MNFQDFKDFYNRLTGNEPPNYEPSEPNNFDTGYEREGGEFYFKDTRPGVTSKNNKSAYYNETQAERLIQRALNDKLSPEEVLATPMIEGTIASRLPYMGRMGAIADIQGMKHIGGQDWFDYMPAMYHDFFSRIQNFRGDNKTEKRLVKAGYTLPWGKNEPRGMVMNNPLFAEVIAMERLKEAQEKYPIDIGRRIGFYQHSNASSDEKQKRLAMVRALRLDPYIQGIIQRNKNLR